MTTTNAVRSHIRRRVRDDSFRRWIVRFLAELVDIDTAVKADVAKLAAGERAVIRRITSELEAVCGDAVQVELAPVDPAIADDPYFSRLYYTRSEAGPEGLTVRQCYKGRGNLLAVFPGEGGGQGGRPCIWNAHLDTVAPFYPAAVSDGETGRSARVAGRGAADDKASVAMLAGQIRLLEECRQRFGLRLACDRVYQFVIDEEMGGNGTLSAVRDPRFAGWQVVVGESTGNVPYPANRGAVWFHVEMDGSSDPRINLVEMAAHVVLALEGAGRAIRAESDHPLFRPEHVQTCHGILGPHGRHPSTVNDLVPLTLAPAGKVTAGRLDALRQVLRAGLNEYVARYGDKSAETDQQGRVKVPAHFEIDDSSEPLVLKVHGQAGHMGAIHTLDCAIIKAAFLIAAIVRANEESVKPFWTVGLAGVAPTDRRLALEGGQGFVPTHEMADVQRRLAEAAEPGARDYVRSLGVEPAGRLTATSFEKLHNAAFASPVDMPAMKAMRRAYGALGLDWPAPSGWGVSCDARIFAREGHPVLTYGPGRLEDCHGPDEFVEIDQLLEAIAVSALTQIAVSNGGF